MSNNWKNKANDFEFHTPKKILLLNSNHLKCSCGYIIKSLTLKYNNKTNINTKHSKTHATLVHY